jgi:hypothetical protein
MTPVTKEVEYLASQMSHQVQLSGPNHPNQEIQILEPCSSLSGTPQADRIKVVRKCASGNVSAIAPSDFSALCALSVSTLSSLLSLCRGGSLEARYPPIPTASE